MTVSPLSTCWLARRTGRRSMILRQYLHVDPVAASYLYGCGGRAAAAVVDPIGEIGPYIDAADKGVDQNQKRELLPIGAQPEVDGRARQNHAPSFGCCRHCSGIDRANPCRVRRRRRHLSQHGLHEGVLVLNPQRLVVSPLKPDRGRRLAAQAAPADRAGIRARQHFQIIGKRLEPLCASKQGARAVFGLAGELGSAEIANHERVARQHKPRLVGTGPIGNEK